MILLFVVMLSLPGSTNDGWITGQYAQGYSEYRTISECEARRARVIEYAETLTSVTLVSKCATGSDIVEYNSFRKADTAEGPKT